MDLNEFVKKFTEQFEETNPSEITPECNFRELEEWSSLVALGVIAFVKTTYNKRLTAADMRSCTTVMDLYELIGGR